MYDEFAYFRVAVSVGEVGNVDALRQVDADSGLAVGHRLGMQHTSVGGIDGEQGRTVAVVHNHDFAASARWVGINTQMAVIRDVISFSFSKAFILTFSIDTNLIIPVFQRTSYVIILIIKGAFIKIKVVLNSIRGILPLVIIFFITRITFIIDIRINQNQNIFIILLMVFRLDSLDVFDASCHCDICVKGIGATSYVVRNSNRNLMLSYGFPNHFEAISRDSSYSLCI